ncbi:MAG: FAD-dependent oxidoreductase [Chloroflexi bacterium]|nr:FAD-dependent oxidoreductase [Chloroflexota bacterium]
MYKGCVPTKTLLRSAKIFDLVKKAQDFGISTGAVSVDFARVMARKDAIIAQASPLESQRALERKGIAVLLGTASFVSPSELRVGSRTIRGRRFIIATGSRPFVPPVDGLKDIGFITSDEALDLRRLPKSIVIIGGGPIGVEFAQVFGRFGSKVTILENSDRILDKEDGEVSLAIQGYLAQEGIGISTGVNVQRATRELGEKVVVAEVNRGRQAFRAEEIMVATGRMPNVDGLDIQVAGVQPQRRGLAIDDELRTTAEHVWTAGDVAGRYQFTHVANYEGEIAANNALTDRPLKADYRVIPKATFTDPEVASVGLTEMQARQEGHRVIVGRFPFQQVEKSIIDGEAKGFAKLVVDEGSRQILGGHVVGPEATDLVNEIAVAMNGHMTVDALAESIHAFPSISEGVRFAARELVVLEQARLACCVA